jgi:hypothetical protein
MASSIARSRRRKVAPPGSLLLAGNKRLLDLAIEIRQLYHSKSEIIHTRIVGDANKSLHSFFYEITIAAVLSFFKPALQDTQIIYK